MQLAAESRSCTICAIINSNIHGTSRALQSLQLRHKLSELLEFFKLVMLSKIYMRLHFFLHSWFFKKSTHRKEQLNWIWPYSRFHSGGRVLLCEPIYKIMTFNKRDMEGVRRIISKGRIKAAIRNNKNMTICSMCKNDQQGKAMRRETNF